MRTTTFRLLRGKGHLALPLAGCILIAAAAFTVALWAGLLVAGLGCFFVEWRIVAEGSQR